MTDELFAAACRLRLRRTGLGNTEIAQGLGLGIAQFSSWRIGGLADPESRFRENYRAAYRAFLDEQAVRSSAMAEVST